MLGGQMAFSLFNTNVLNKSKARSSTELTLLKKKPRLDEKELLDAYNNGRRNFAQEELPNLNLAKAKGDFFKRWADGFLKLIDDNDLN